MCKARAGADPVCAVTSRRLFFLAGLTILFLSLARPQTVVNLPREEGTVILAFDVSGSMAADDMKPTRMEAAKAAARAFIERQPSTVQIGVVAFSDSGFSVQSPTNDQEAILAAIDRLRPQRGTSLARGIEASLNTIAIAQGQGGQGNDPALSGGPTAEPTPSPTPVPKGMYTPAVIVLLTDGENNENPNPLVAAQAAADRGVRIYTVGIGSAAGSILHIEGFTVHSQLDEAALKQISQHNWRQVLQRRKPARPAVHLRKPQPGAGDQAGKNGSHLIIRGRQYGNAADGWGIINALVQPRAVTGHPLFFTGGIGGL